MVHKFYNDNLVANKFVIKRFYFTFCLYFNVQNIYVNVHNKFFNPKLK
jgi:hypothetical protein